MHSNVIWFLDPQLRPAAWMSTDIYRIPNLQITNLIPSINLKSYNSATYHFQWFASVRSAWLFVEEKLTKAYWGER